MVRINKFILFFCILLMTECHSAPQRIESFICSQNIKKNSNLELDMKKVLCDYDRLFLVGSLTPLSCVRDMLGIPSYRKENNASNALMGNDSDNYFILLKKDGRIVYEEEFNYNNTKVRFEIETFNVIKGKGFFDGENIVADGYYLDNSLFLVTEKKGLYFVYGQGQDK